MNEDKYPGVSDSQGVIHWAVEPGEDFDHACDMIGEGTGVTCPQCLGGIIMQLQAELDKALHELRRYDPESYKCNPKCRSCSDQGIGFLI